MGWSARTLGAAGSSDRRRPGGLCAVHCAPASQWPLGLRVLFEQASVSEGSSTGGRASGPRDRSDIGGGRFQARWATQNEGRRALTGSSKVTTVTCALIPDIDG